jgi:hypothetical protein
VVVRRALVLILLAAGCRTWDVNAFGVPLGEQPRHVVAASDEDLSTEEKLGVILLVGVAVGAGIAVAVAAD